MWSKISIALIGMVSILTLSGCGFEPIYGSSQRSVESSAELATVRIDPIENRVGQMLRNHLLNSINPQGEPSRAAYRLIVDVTESKQELAVQKSEFATRSNLILTAQYRLVKAGEESNKGQGVVMTRNSTTTASYNFLTNEFATLSAEADARERGVRDLSEDITRQLALYFRSQAKAPPK